MQFQLRPLSDRVFTVIILSIIAVSVSFSEAFSRFDNLHYDLGRYFNFKSAPEDIVIVAIDEVSLATIGRWPWSRTTHADLVTKLKKEQAKVIGLDVIFAEPDLKQVQADIALAKAIEQAGNVVLPEFFEVPSLRTPMRLSLPLANFAQHAAAIGSVHVPLDADGIARGIYLWEALGSNRVLHFSQAVLQVAGQLPASISLAPPNDLLGRVATLTSVESRRVKFLGDSGHFQRISYLNVLTGDYSENFFKNKIVLVGATAVGMGDALPTPVSMQSQLMPGVEFHANTIAAMRSADLIIKAPVWFTALVCMLLAIIPVIFLPQFTPLKSLLMMAFYYFLITTFTIAIPYFFNVWIAPAGALIAILLAYPLWSWLKLDSARGYLDEELMVLNAELALLGVKKNDLHYISGEDLMASSIANVRTASKHLNALHAERRDTLSFISHDIRSPLAAAILLLKESEIGALRYSERIVKMLNRALEMADDFLQSSRAEMADTAKFQDVNLINVLQQAVDDVYATAQAKQIKLNLNIAEDSYWLKGDFGLLERAFSNVLLNSIKYSPENANVQVELAQKNNQAVLKITDTGLGIAPEKIIRLFKRYSRAEGQQQLSEGTGLGLYFVDVTVSNHKGTIAVESELGIGTSFTITLPLEISN